MIQPLNFPLPFLFVRTSQWWRWSLLAFFLLPSAVVIGFALRVLGSALLSLLSSEASKNELFQIMSELIWLVHSSTCGRM